MKRKSYLYPILVTFSIFLFGILPSNGNGNQVKNEPYIVGSGEMPGSAKGVHINGNYAYVAALGTGLQVVDISDPQNPIIAGSVDMPYSGRAWDVFVKEGFAYVTNDVGTFDNQHFRLEVIDIGNPQNPVIIGSTGANGFPEDIHVMDNYAYVAWHASTLDGGLKIFDISSPQSPLFLSSINTGSMSLMGVSVNGSYAYVANGWNSLEVFDISDPQNPISVSSIDIIAPTAVHVEDGYAYVAGSESFEILDVSNPQNPIIVGSIEISLLSKGIYVSGDYAYIAAQENGLQIFDITDPQNPVIADSVDTPEGFATDVYVYGSYAYVTDGNYLHVIYTTYDVELEPDNIILTTGIWLNPGWNLISIFFEQSDTSAETIFSNVKNNITSAWKYTDNNWVVFLPGFSQKEMNSYLAEKGFVEMTEINCGEGFWVNSNTYQGLTISGIKPENSSYSLVKGWNLIGLKSNETRTISELITNNEEQITSIWKWQDNNWAVYLPSLGAEATATYAGSKGFIVLEEINPGEGFWVNCIDDMTLQ